MSKDIAVVEQDPTLAKPRIPYHSAVLERFGIDRSDWNTLVNVVFPAAESTESVVMALAYCKARRLDVFKRPIHIVPIWNAKLNKVVDTVWPGISELRTTAARTGAYAGQDAAVFGPSVVMELGKVTLEVPEWCQVTVYRMVGGMRVPFVGPRVRWLETYATRRHDADEPNSMWHDRPWGQLEKCAEAAALRRAFPEELGSDMIPEEVERGVERRQVDNEAERTKRPAAFDKLKELQANQNAQQADGAQGSAAGGGDTTPADRPVPAAAPGNGAQGGKAADKASMFD